MPCLQAGCGIPVGPPGLGRAVDSGPSPSPAPWALSQKPPSTSSGCCSIAWWGFTATHSLLPSPGFVRADCDTLLPKHTQLGKRLATHDPAPPVSAFL